MLVARTDFKFNTLKLPSTSDSTSLDVQLEANSSIHDIVDAAIKDETLKRPSVIYFYTSKKNTKTKKACDRFATALKSLVKRECSIALSKVFDNYQVDVSASKMFKNINVDKVPLFVVVTPDKKVISKTGGTGKEVTAKKAFECMVKGASKMGIRLKTVVKDLSKLADDVCKYTAEIKKAKGLLAAAEKKGKKSSITIHRKSVEKLEKKLAEAIAKEEKIYASINEKIASKI